MKSAPLVIVAIAALIGPRAVCAQSQDALLSGYTMTSWTLSDGIPVGPIYALAQDAEGYLWLGTTGGAVRFDGARFTRWDAIYSRTMPGIDVHALRVSRDGTLWVGFDRSAGRVTVAALRQGTLVTASTGRPPRGPTTSIVDDHTGRVWAVSDSALYRLHNGRWDLMRQGALGRATVVSVREDRNGLLWVGTRQGVFRTRDGDSFELVEEGIARETSEGADGTLWMTDTAHGARRQGARAPLTGIDGLGMRLLHDSRGNMWVATTGQGLWRIRDSGEATARLIERATVQTGLSSNAVQSLLEDRDGNIWVGTMLGLHSLTPQQFTPLAAGALVRAVLPDPDGSVWVGTANGLMQFRREGATWRGRRVVDGDIRSLFRDPHGHTWATTNDGLRGLVHGRFGPPRVQPGAAPACADGAIVGWPEEAFDAEGVRSANAASSGPAGTPTPVLWPFCARHGVVWVARRGGSLMLRQGHRIVATIEPPSSLAESQRTVEAIFEDAHGTMWIGGTVGLLRIQDGEMVQPGGRDGLPAQRVMAITQDAGGDLWLAVDRGPLFAGRRAALIRLRPADFERGAKADTRRGHYKIYDAIDGVAGVPVGAAAAARSTDGSLWFAIGGSLTVVDPDQLARERGRADASARIVGATIDDRALAPTTAGILPAGTRKVQIDYTALRLTAPGQIRFRYRLDGFDHEWVDAGARRQAYYTNLAPGQYVFRVQANSDGLTWSRPEARWSFAVRPAFWQTGWFYAFGMLTLLAAAWGAAHTRVWILHRQFAATLAERTRLSREIHDTMLQSLVGIALQVQAIARRCGPLASEQQSQLVALRRDVEDYIREARQAIQNLRSPLLEGSGLAGALAEIGRRTVAPPTQFEVSADQLVGVSAATEGELLRIGQEAITNAARHAAATRIDADIRQESNAVRLRVIDDGHGFDVAGMLSAGVGHYGLTGMQERAARVGGRLTITSSEHGTTVEAIVPARQRA